MANHFGPLTMETLACPSGDVLAHGRPYHFGADGLTRAFHAGMPKAVDDIKDGPSEVQRDEWPSRAVADIDHEAGASYVDVLEI